MSVDLQQSIASLRLLVCMAKADGVLRDEERDSLRSALQVALQDFTLPDGLTLETLLAREDSLDDVIASIVSPEARDQAYASAYAMACADGDCSPEEAALLARLRREFQIDDTQDRLLGEVFKPSHQQIVRGKEGAAPAFEGLERQAKVQQETRKTAIVSAVLGAFPVPGLAIATDLAVVALQVALAKDIARFWGRQMDSVSARRKLAEFGVGTGARIAITNVLKIFPGWGAAVGALTAYASTYAVGRTMDRYFSSGEGLDAAQLVAEFEKAKAEGKTVYEEDKRTIADREAAGRDQVKELGRQLERGDISPEEFVRRSTTTL